MKKAVIPILIAAILCSFLTGCGDTLPDGCETYDVMVQGALFGGKGDDRIKTEVSFDFGWVTSADNTKYNKELAAFAAILSDDVYFRTKDLDKGTQNRILFDGENEEEYDQTAFLKNVGFSDVQFIESHKAKEYAGDNNDSATLLLAHTIVDETYDLYAVIVRGCFSIQEWVSVFDPGCDSETYTELTGEHPEWTDKTAYKGMDIAKNRALAFINGFITQNDDPKYENCMLITGHSRGGGIANMIGAEMENRKDIRSYTYTFNAPGVTTDEKSGEYRTVFNIFDSNDYYVDPLPFGKEEFYRYGRDITLAITDSDEVKAEITKLKGRDDFISLDAKAKSEFEDLFGQCFPDRASLYHMTTVTQTFDTEEAAAAYAEQCLTLIGSENGLGLEGFCSIESSETEGKYVVSMKYCGAAILISFAKSLAYGEAAGEAAIELFKEDTAACEMLDFLMTNAAGINGGHLLINSFVLCRYGTLE